MELSSVKQYLIEKFQGWIHEQRSLHLTHARKLREDERSRLSDYFDGEILDSARIATIDHMSNPPFYSELIEAGMPVPLDLTQAIGFTLIDCILIQRELWAFPSMAFSTIFHEMVHVVQTDILGPERLIELYAENILQDEYRNVLFERQAYDLTERFDRGEAGFSVRDIVQDDLRKLLRPNP